MLSKHKLHHRERVWSYAIWLLTSRLLLTGSLLLAACSPAPAIPQEFNAQRALADVEYQLSLGPRVPGSDAHRQAGDWMRKELEAAGWQVQLQETTAEVNGVKQPVRNVIARIGQGLPWIVLGAHYDSRLLADQDLDPALRLQPVPGANDGASGAALLLELGRVLPARLPDLRYTQVWLVFFDVEDNGRLPDWDWILGSRAFVASLTDLPDAAVIVDMIGDADLNIYQERNSDPTLTAEIWAAAAALGHEQQFIPQPKYQILDDHTPFLEAGIPAVDIIDFDYPYWHTAQDTADKVSANSLLIVGQVLIKWLSR